MVNSPVILKCVITDITILYHFREMILQSDIIIFPCKKMILQSAIIDIGICYHFEEMILKFDIITAKMY